MRYNCSTDCPLDAGPRLFRAMHRAQLNFAAALGNRDYFCRVNRFRDRFSPRDISHAIRDLRDNVPDVTKFIVSRVRNVRVEIFGIYRFEVYFR